MPSKTISVTNGDGSTRTITIPDRSRFAGVKTFSRNGKLDDNTTSIQVTVSGHSDLDGVYTGSVGTDLPWTQQGGNGKIRTSGYNAENDDQIWFVMDDNDYDPDGDSEAAYQWSGSGESPAPWTHLPSSHAVTIEPVPETVTVDRTASVIDSDRKGESRPLLSKVVGGAAAAYSLRDLNDKQGNNKVVEVRRSSDDTDRTFLAKEVSNGTLEAWVNEDYAKYTSDFSSGTNSWGDSLDDLTAAGNIDGIGGLDDNLRLTIGSATSQHRAFRSNIFPVSQKINFSIRVFIPSTNSVVDSFRIADASGTQIIASTTPTQDEWVTVTASNVTPTNNSGQLRLFLQDGGTSTFAGNGSDVIYLREVTVTQVTSDGFVSKWYDQSGHSKDAVQATASNQPKIVNAGVLVDKGIDFDGVSSQSLEPPFLLPTIQNSSTFVVSTPHSVSGGYTFMANRSLDRVYFRPNTVHIGHPVNTLNAGMSVDVRAVQTITGTSGGLFTYFKDGSSVGTANYTGNVSGGDTWIGSGNNGTAEFNGIINEIIVYDTDQSANRPAIEANINNQYDIY